MTTTIFATYWIMTNVNCHTIYRSIPQEGLSNATQRFFYIWLCSFQVLSFWITKQTVGGLLFCYSFKSNGHDFLPWLLCTKSFDTNWLSQMIHLTKEEENKKNHWRCISIERRFNDFRCGRKRKLWSKRKTKNCVNERQNLCINGKCSGINS